MKVNLKSRRAELHTVRVGEESFEVEMRPPSFAERLTDNEIASLSSKKDGSWLLHRLRTTVVGWTGLTDDVGELIPFSWEHLASLCEQYPEVYHQLITLAHQAYQNLTKAERKNSAGPA